MQLFDYAKGLVDEEKQTFIAAAKLSLLIWRKVTALVSTELSSELSASLLEQ